MKTYQSFDICVPRQFVEQVCQRKSTSDMRKGRNLLTQSHEKIWKIAEDLKTYLLICYITAKPKNIGESTTYSPPAGNMIIYFIKLNRHDAEIGECLSFSFSDQKYFSSHH